MSRDTMRLIFTVIALIQMLLLIFLLTYSKNKSKEEISVNVPLNVAYYGFCTLSAGYIIVPIVQIVLLYIIRV